MKILILGDGNFSFSLALARHLFEPLKNGDLNAGYQYLGLDSCQHVSMHTTSFDSYQELISKYPESEAILKKLAKYPQVSIEHCVNAWELERHFDHCFDIVIWNHPHLHREDFRLHRFLLAHFLNSATKRMQAKSKLCISLVEGQETRWQLIEQANRFNLGLSNIMPLLESDFPGYICKRNNTGKSFKNEKTLKQHCNASMKSFVYQFTYQEGATLTRSPVLIDDLNLSERLKISNDEEQPNKSAEIKKIVQWSVEEDKKQKATAKQQKHKLKNDGQTKANVEDRSLLYQCPDCTKILPTLRGIRQHHHMIHVLKLMPSPDELTDSIVCELCDGRKFARDVDFRAHCIQKHSTLQEEDRRVLGIIEESSEPNGEYKYYPCDVCGQSVMDTGNESNDGMMVHLESLKPLIGQIMNCPLPDCISAKKSFLETRALEQHYRMCRYGRVHQNDAVGQ